MANAILSGGYDEPPQEDDDDSNENPLVRDLLAHNNEKKETICEEIELNNAGEEKKEENKIDWELLDNMIDNFFETPQEEMLSVLAGYFCKIISSLMSKEQNKFLEYILLKRDGAIFNGLMQHMTHHSMA